MKWFTQFFSLLLSTSDKQSKVITHAQRSENMNTPRMATHPAGNSSLFTLHLISPFRNNERNPHTLATDNKHV